MHRHLRSTGLNELASDTLSETLPSQAWNKAETPFVSNGYFLFIHHVHQACDESFAGIDGILEVYFVYVGDVETDTLCVLCIIKYEWKYRLVHVYGVADFAYDIYGLVGIDRTYEDNGLGHFDGIND